MDFYESFLVHEPKGRTECDCSEPHEQSEMSQDGVDQREQGESVTQGIRNHGYIEVYKLTQGQGRHVIDETIKERMVCYRPGPMWGDDLCSHPSASARAQKEE